MHLRVGHADRFTPHITKPVERAPDIGLMEMMRCRDNDVDPHDIGIEPHRPTAAPSPDDVGLWEHAREVSGLCAAQYERRFRYREQSHFRSAGRLPRK